MKTDLYRVLNRALTNEFKTAYRGSTVQSFVIWCFLKYCLDNKLCKDTKEGLDNLANILTDFYSKTVDANRVEKLFADVDEMYGQDRAISRMSSFFREETKFHEDIINVIAQLNFKTNLEETLDLIKASIHNLQNNLGGRYAFGGTNLGISKTASLLLNVEKKDTFADFCCGTGLSTLEIVKDLNTRIELSDINPDARATSLMVLIMFGYKNIKVSDFDPSSKEKATKLFADLPILPDMVNEKMSASTKYHADFLIKAKNMIDAEGKAVLVVPGKYLFSAVDAVRYSRDVLVIEECLDAVIALPYTFEGTAALANLVVLRKGVKNPIFVDASKFESNSDGIEQIVDIYNSRKEINGVSKVLSKDEILAQGTSFSPARYTIKETTINVEKELEETEEKLNAALAHLNELMNK